MGKQRIFGTLDPFVEAGAAMGRKSANSGFLGALLRAEAFDECHFYPGGGSAVTQLSSDLAAGWPGLWEQGRLKVFPRAELPRRLHETDYHCFHQSDCIALPAHLGRLRNAHSREIFPITSVTHSLSRADYAEAFLRHLWPGTTPRDCIIATSRAAQSAVSGFFESLIDGYGLSPERARRPDVSIVPLGIDIRAKPTDAERESSRTELGLEQNQVCILVFGRVSHHSKMDFLPLFRAFQRLFAAGLPREAVRLDIAGWTEDNDDYPALITELAANMGLNMRLHARPDESLKHKLYTAADIFCSLSDNLQETFGLTMLEAGAYELPVVVADWDGYRDLIVHDETGLLVPTMFPGDTAGVDAVSRLLYDNQYHLLLSQQTVVDIPKTAEALAAFIHDPAKRQQYGCAGRKRVEANFSWDKVVQEYLALWERLWVEPVNAAPLRDIPHPLHVPFGEVFKAWPSEQLTPETQLVWTTTGAAVHREKEYPLLYSGLSEWLEPAHIRPLVFHARKPLSLASLLEKVAGLGLSEQQAAFSIRWSIKHDLLEVVR